MLPLAAGEARITPFEDGSFQIDPDGPMLAKLLPVYSGETVVDVVAWEAGTDRPWWIRRRIASYIGDEEISRGAWYGRPVRLVETPRQWLEFGGQAVVVLDWQLDLRALFRDVPEVIAETPALLKFLKRRLVEQTTPTFRLRCAQ